MKTKLRDYLLLTGICSAVLLAFFPKPLLCPDKYAFAPGGDGIKNYYTPAYYLKYDHGFHFTGMNYPYGEHIIYTDNQPALSLALNWIDDNLFTLHDRTVGILNIMMLLSVIVCAWCIYAILRRFFMPSWYAIIVSIIISFLSPQLLRITGHYALAYTFFFPLCWLLFMKYTDVEKKWLYFIILATIVIVFSFIHPYYGLLSALFFLSVACVYTWENKKGNLSWKFLLHTLLLAFLPLLFTQIFMQFTDVVNDRPQSPYGFLTYRASFESIFLPTFGNYHSWITSIINLKIIQPEGRAYVGIIGIFILLFVLIKWIRRMVSNKKIHTPMPVLPRDLSLYLWTGVWVLLFSMAIPFIWSMEFLLDWLTPLKQFRSPGRFAWVFFYIFTIFSSIYFYLIYRTWRYKANVVSISLLSATLILWSGDAYHNISFLEKHGINGGYENSFSKENCFYDTILKENGYSIDDFQAILALPYFLEGSEKLYILRGGASVVEAMKASYDTGLPMLQGMMSRTSLSQTLKLAQLMSGDLIEKKIITELNKKPILLLTVNAEVWEIEKPLVKKGTIIWSNDRISLYVLPLSAFDTQFHEVVETFKNNVSNFVYYDKRYYTEDSTQGVFLKSFDDKEMEISFYGAGAAVADKGIIEILDTTVILSKGTAMEGSIWIKAFRETPAFPLIHFEQYDTTGKLVETGVTNPKFLTDIVGDWVRVSLPFVLAGENNRIRFYMEGVKISADEFLLRPTGINVYHHIASDDSFWLNGYPIGSK